MIGHGSWKTRNKILPGVYINIAGNNRFDVPEHIEPDIPVEIRASELSVGSTVYLYENNSPVEYLVINQGIPTNSRRYDTSCNGTWLLRKDIYEKQPWHSSDNNRYMMSTIHSYLNGDFLNLFDPVTQDAIKRVKIPHFRGNGGSPLSITTSGLSAKIFLLSCNEVGFTSSNTAPSYTTFDGDCLEYFKNNATSKRLAYLDGTATAWWLRVPYPKNTTHACLVNANGSYAYGQCTASRGVRPALIISSDAIFDEHTLILKGVG